MAPGRRRARIEERRRLRRAATIEAAVARGAGLDVRNQIAGARNLSAWGGALFGIAAACLAPGAIGDVASGWGLAAAFTAVPALVLLRRTWMLHRAYNELDDPDDPTLTEGDEELAHLRRLVRSMDNRSTQRAGRSAIAAAAQGYAERRRVLERRGHVEALMDDATSHLGEDALAADLDACDLEVAELDRHLENLIAAVADLADAADESRRRAIQNVCEATDAVNALASAMKELQTPG